nr:MAG TPA: hypothetical protein [Caudoviricetes sp.]
MNLRYSLPIIGRKSKLYLISIHFSCHKKLLSLLTFIFRKIKKNALKE